jgi:type IV pilus assembly protein PilN
MIKINLLSEGKRPAAVRKTKASAVKLDGQDVGLWMILAGAVLGAIALAVVWWMLDRDLKARVLEVEAAQREVEALANVIKEVEDYKAKKTELERKIGIINDLKLNQRGPVRVMDHISRALPELLWMDRLKMNATKIEVEGRAFNTNAVANFIENLDKVPEFEEPTLQDTQEQPGGVYKFTINFTYSFTPRAPEAGTAASTPEAGGAAETAPAATAPTSG